MTLMILAVATARSMRCCACNLIDSGRMPRARTSLASCTWEASRTDHSVLNITSSTLEYGAFKEKSKQHSIWYLTSSCDASWYNSWQTLLRAQNGQTRWEALEVKWVLVAHLGSMYQCACTICMLHFKLAQVRLGTWRTSKSWCVEF